MDQAIAPHPGYQRVVEVFGTAAEVARALRISPQAVSSWKFTGVPADRAIELERLRPHELRAIDIATRRA